MTLSFHRSLLLFVSCYGIGLVGRGFREWTGKSPPPSFYDYLYSYFHYFYVYCAAYETHSLRKAWKSLNRFSMALKNCVSDRLSSDLIISSDWIQITANMVTFSKKSALITFEMCLFSKVKL